MESSGKHSRDPEIDPTFEKLNLLEGLLRNNDITEIDEAIELGRTVLASAYVRRFRFIRLLEAFRRTNKSEYLNESINTFRQVLERPTIHFLRSTTLRQLFQSLLTRSESFPGNPMRDMEEGLEILSQCAKRRICELARSILVCMRVGIRRAG